MRDSFRPRKSFGGNRTGSSSRGNFRDRSSGRKEMFDAVCDQCGKNCKVPFRPTNSKPIYCSECFESVEKDRDNGNFRDMKNPMINSSMSNNKDNKEYEQLKEHMCSISAKLDKILKIITPKE